MHFVSKISIGRAVVCYAAAVILASCTGENSDGTFQGEPIIAGSDPNAVWHKIDDPDFPAVMLTHEKGSVGIGIFQRDTGSPILTLRDDDNDGVFDLLTYSAVTESGETLVDVEDYGMDGQPDLILNHQVSSASVFVGGRWHKVDGVGTESVTVEIDGKRIPLKEIVTELRGSN